MLSPFAFHTAPAWPFSPGSSYIHLYPPLSLKIHIKRHWNSYVHTCSPSLRASEWPYNGGSGVIPICSAPCAPVASIKVPHVRWFVRHVVPHSSVRCTNCVLNSVISVCFRFLNVPCESMLHTGHSGIQAKIFCFLKPYSLYDIQFDGLSPLLSQATHHL